MDNNKKNVEQPFAFFSMKKLKLPDVAKAIAHNRRAIPAELDGKHNGIDPDRVHLNYHLHGEKTVEEVQAEWNRFFYEYTLFGSKMPRRDFVALIEIVVSVSANDKIASDSELLAAYFIDACEWIKRNFGADLVLSFDVHKDQPNPHAHALIIPLVNGKMNGSDIMKYFNMQRLLNLYAKEVGAKHGYKSKVERLSPMQKEDMYKAVINVITHNPAYAGRTNSALWEAERDSIRADPLPYFQLLGLELKTNIPSPKKVKGFVDIARSHGKGTHIK